MTPVAYSSTLVAPSGRAMPFDTNGSPAGVAASRGAASVNGGSSGAGKKPFRHIDDIVSVGVDLDPHTPLRKLLELGDGHMRQATTFKDFRRPDLALQEYIKAFTVAVDKVPKHKDYPSLKSDRGDLGRLYNALKVKITNNGSTFDKIKDEIKADNRRSGVRPSKLSTDTSEHALMNLPRTPSTAPSQNHPAKSKGLDATPGSDSKSKPVVHPKPRTLHGNSIKPAATMTPQDLAARFAKLRDSQDNRPGGALSNARIVPPIDSSVSIMPKLPDAIYSPARGTVTSEVANLPSSTPRGMFSRTNSIATAPSASARTSMETAIRTFNNEQFVAAHTYGDSQSISRATGVAIPPGDTISVQELIEYMNQGSDAIRLLLIDARDRGSFDEGHIMSQRTICVEPEILKRGSISADDIADSMVLAPSEEKLAIEQRDKVDLIVMYDQDSTILPGSLTGDPQEIALYTLSQALLHYSYDRPLKNPPKLLAGGVDAWANELGMQSLETSKTSINGSSKKGRSNLRRARNQTRTLGREEVEQFEEIIKEGRADSFDYTRSREEFDRRFPSVTGLPESMSSPAVQRSPAGYAIESDSDDFLSGLAPTPPSRPKPAAAKTRYSGFESSHDEPTVAGAAMLAGSTSQVLRTGLFNPGNWCYANSAIQAILHSEGFVDEMLDVNWPLNNQPENPHGLSDHPQLMSKILGNLLQWLNKRQFPVMRANTLMHYLRSIHSGYEISGTKVAFGDEHQHDTHELISFIFELLDHETATPLVISPSKSPAPGSRAQVVFSAWARELAAGFSITKRHWTIVQSTESKCNNCGKEESAAVCSRYLTYPVDNGDLPTAIEAEADVMHAEAKCECGGAGKRYKSRFARFPPLLCVHLQRSVAGGAKSHSAFSFPLTDLDLGRWGEDAQTRGQIHDSLGEGRHSEGFSVGSKYDIYAIIQHVGATANSGHYWTWLKTGPTTWLKCNDSSITPETKSKKSLLEFNNELWSPKKGDATPVVLMYKRRERPQIFE